LTPTVWEEHAARTWSRISVVFVLAEGVELVVEVELEAVANEEDVLSSAHEQAGEVVGQAQIAVLVTVLVVVTVMVLVTVLLLGEMLT
jgi:hypothetical protein